MKSNNIENQTTLNRKMHAFIDWMDTQEKFCWTMEIKVLDNFIYDDKERRKLQSLSTHYMENTFTNVMLIILFQTQVNLVLTMVYMLGKLVHIGFPFP